MMRIDMLSSPSSVATLVATRPAAVRVLLRHRIDLWRIGHRTIDEACHGAGTSARSLLAEVTAEEQRRPPEWDWSRSTLANIIAMIVERWHRPLEEELPRLEAMTDEFARRYRLPRSEELAAVVRALRDEIGPHFMVEECVVFPLILDGHGRFTPQSTEAMQRGDAYVAELLARLGDLTDDFQLPPDAPLPQAALWHRLAALAHDLAEHLAVETLVLFPRALAGEAPYLRQPLAPRADC